MRRVFAGRAMLILIAAAAIVASGAVPVMAHCDGLDGPVVTAARKAFETGNVNLVLAWVKPDDEQLIRNAFDSTLAVRKLGGTARDLADMYFFETLVRVHRAGEGAPYTGLKPAGRDLGPAIPAADAAIETGTVDSLRALLVRAMDEGLRRYFHEAMTKKANDPNNVDAGRAYVEAYVGFLHYVEGLYQAAQSRAPEHGEATEPSHSQAE